ncbi:MULTISPECIES: hypothetical protein [Paenibacillus]|uniref:hypothetical protein n=1 Tax=Paenibacillus TaxID=44249 RepID=UPI000B86B545|nr:hypothetical protein [Paenibacillus amylolyticus]
MSIIKCSKENCNNYRSSSNESGMCMVCEERRLNDLEKIAAKKNKRATTFKTKEEIASFDYDVCTVKSCRARVFMRGRCKKDYIEFMSSNNKKL